LGARRREHGPIGDDGRAIEPAGAAAMSAAGQPPANAPR
jgi:hypothetical protein